MIDVMIEPLRFLYTDARNGAPRIEYSDHLRCLDVKDGDGVTVATALGVFVEHHAPAGLAFRDDTIEWSGTSSDLASFERDVVDGLAGAFILITQRPLPRRIYLDPGGQLPLVYDAQTRRAACGANDLFCDEEYSERILKDRIKRLVGREGNGWISGTLTAHVGVTRLLPNHFLDLDHFSAHRYWPASDFEHYLDLADAQQEAAAAAKGYVEACSRQYATSVTLTAGFDSRLLMAASRDSRDRIEFFTILSGRRGVDQIVSERLSSTLGLRHRTVRAVEATNEEKARWDRLVSHCVREVNRTSHPTLRQAPGQVMLTGMYGETGRCRLYKHDMDTIDTKLASARFILSRLTLPLDAELLENVDQWLDPIRALPTSAILDLAFNELKFGSWAMGQAPVQKALKMSLAPLSQRKVLNAFMAVPPTVKGTAALFDGIVRGLWPEAMTIPINRTGDWRDAVAPIGKLLQPERARRFLRDRLARP